jgi:outer membrane protein TolC
MGVLLVGVAVAFATETAHAQDGDGLTLREAIGIARGRSADVLSARAEAEAADAEADRELAGYLPSLSARVGGDARYQSDLIPSTDPALAARGGWRKGASLAGDLNWTAYNFGRTSHAVGSARAAARAAALRANGASNEAARFVASTFLSAAFDELLVENAKASVRIRERHAAIAHGMVASGMRPNVEEARTRIELELARLELTRAERQTAQDRTRLAAILMMPPTKQYRLVRPSVLPTITSEPGAAAAQAVERRPEMHAATADVESQDEALSAAGAARLPSLGVGLSGDYSGNRIDGDSSGTFRPTAGFTAQATISIPIFDWSIWGELPARRSRLAATEARAAQTKQELKRDAAISIHTVIAARLLVEQAKAARELSGATLAVMEGRYQSGLATPTDLFDAATRDAEARRETIQAEAGLAVATVDALATTGRLPELER